ncbi:MAG: hypothetical protein C6I01_00620 [Epsilonproteobacteria bacterium]|nr:hypothetical protein [Campylobacterota bacterium]NPA88918.1 hypothetical protein [Campylobacterota bacterium]
MPVTRYIIIPLNQLRKVITIITQHPKVGVFREGVVDKKVALSLIGEEFEVEKLLGEMKRVVKIKTLDKLPKDYL